MTEERMVPVGDVKMSRFQGRTPGDVAGLAASIESNGLFNPAHVWDTGEGLELVCGQRRLEAHKVLGRGEMLAKVHSDMDATAAAALHWSDNADREGLGYYEQSVTAGRILGWGGGSAATGRKEFLKVSGLSTQQLKRLQQLRRLLPEVGSRVDSGDLTQTEGIEISRLPQEEQAGMMRDYLTRISAENPDSPSRDMPFLKEAVAAKLPQKEGDAVGGPRVLADEIGADAPGPSASSSGSGAGEADAAGGKNRESEGDSELPDDDGGEAPPAGKDKCRPGTETVEYGECHDRMRLVMSPKDWIVTVKVPRGSGDSKPTQDVSRSFEKSEDDRSGLHLLLAYMDMAGKMAQEKLEERTGG